MVLPTAGGAERSASEKPVPTAKRVPFGNTITFRYQELSDAGVPRFPSYVGVRTDGAPPTAVKKESAAPPKREVVVVKSEPAPTPAASVEGDPPRYFEFVDGKSSKFWEVSQADNATTTRWGRIGSAGQSKTKAFHRSTPAFRHSAWRDFALLPPFFPREAANG